jgi:toxin ParE1/3/4
MARIVKREAAKRDLVAQWVWYAENAGIETADRFLEAAEESLILVAGHPEAGGRSYFTREELLDIRRFPVTGGFDRILLFYFPLQDGIDLVRVLHGSRDLKRLFDESPFD